MDREKFSSSMSGVIAACLVGLAVSGGSIFVYNFKNANKAAKHQEKPAVAAYKDEKTADAVEKGEKVPHVLLINGKEEFLFESEEDARGVLDRLKQRIEEDEAKNGAKVLEMVIKDDVTIVKAEGAALALEQVDVDTAVEKLMGVRGTAKKYEIKAGDSLWTIARNNDMRVNEILSANPGLSAEKIKPGQTIDLTMTVPYLNIELKTEATMDEEIPFETKTVTDNTMYTGQSKIIESGQKGLKRVIAAITKLNGRETSKTVLSSTILKNPVVQVISKGTKAMAGTGNFSWPSRGSLTSRYGQRWGRTHEGIDIAASKGAPIYAADSGTVIYAGWDGGYGNVVRISHGNGYVTVYGHCSSIAVKVGQSVKKGQYIAAVGSTGNSTGPHVHFEVRLNGVAQNPLKYLR